MSDHPADKIAKVVALATSPDYYEAQSAYAKALDMVGNLDLDLLVTLAGQRDALLRDLRIEYTRLISEKERANKRTTGDLVGRALSLLQHYERIDALLKIPGVVAVLFSSRSFKARGHPRRPTISSPQCSAAAATNKTTRNGGSAYEWLPHHQTRTR